MAEKNDRPVGYKNPPVHSRFRKGGPQPRRAKTAGKGIDVHALLMEPVKVTDGSTSRKMHVYEIALLKLAGLALKGSMTAAARLLKELIKQGAIGLQHTASKWPESLHIPVDYDPEEWMKNLNIYGPPPWPLEHDGLCHIEDYRDALRKR